MRNRRVTTIIATLALVGSVLATGWSLVEFPPRVEATLPEGTGRELAREALKLLGPQGRITVLARDTATFPQPAADLQLESFEQEVRKAKATVAATQLLQLDPLRPVQVPPGDFFELIRRGATGDVIVSMMGPPLLNAEQRAMVGEMKPKIVAFCPGNQAEYIDLRFLFEHRLLHAALISRARRSPGLPARSSRLSLDDLYVCVTPANLSALPPATGDSTPDRNR